VKPPRDKAGASRRGRALLVRAWLALSLLAAWPAFSTERDCRYVEETVGMDPQASQGVLLPDTDLFRPILADQREPRFYADYRRVHFRSASSAALSEGNGQNVDVTLVAFGGEFGLWGLRQPHGCDGFQVSIFGVLFAQFNLDSQSFDLLNADYLVGPMLTYRSGRLSGRLRFFHQSSHLGDEFLLNYAIAHGVTRQNLSFEVIDLLVSFEDTWWRVSAAAVSSPSAARIRTWRPRRESSSLVSSSARRTRGAG
jgi:hypothetical protein